MNKSSVLLVLLIGFLFSCSSDSVADQIVGSWDLNQANYTSCDDPSENRNIALACVDNCEKTVLVFGEAGTILTTYSDIEDGVSTVTDTENGTWSITTEPMVELCISGEECFTLDVTFSGDIMTGLGNVDGCTVEFRFAKSL